MRCGFFDSPRLFFHFSQLPTSSPSLFETKDGIAQGDADDGQIVKKDERGQSRSNQVVPTVAAKVFDYVHILSDVEITVQSILPAHEPDEQQEIRTIEEEDQGRQDEEAYIAVQKQIREEQERQVRIDVEHPKRKRKNSNARNRIVWNKALSLLNKINNVLVQWLSSSKGSIDRTK
ncbi:unnamed protein product [Caenorhabditis nigoni]